MRPGMDCCHRVLLSSFVVILIFGTACSSDNGGGDTGQDPDGPPDISEMLETADTLPDPTVDDTGQEDAGPTDVVSEEGGEVELCEGVTCSDFCDRVFECTGEVDPEALAECLESCRLDFPGDPVLVECICDNIEGECASLLACAMG
jgi:hypothetical protein